VQGVQTFDTHNRPFVHSAVLWQSPGTHAPPTQMLPAPQLVSSGHGPHRWALHVCPVGQSLLLWQSPATHDPPTQM
jgi:hypothetical protein